MDAEAGMFAPDSVSWRVFGEHTVALGGLRSLYLQALHPLAMAGVAQNSSFRTEPWRRLVHTWGYLRTVLYGTTADAQEAAGRLRRMHARMRATDPRTGETFRLDEPDLLRWVHVAEVESFLTTVRRAGLRLTAAEADRFHAEQRRGAALIGLDPDAVPGTCAEVEAYYDAIRPQLRLTPDAAETAAFLTKLPALPQDWGSRTLRFAVGTAPARLVYRGLAVTAFGLLPPWARELYGRSAHPAVDAVAGLSVRTTRLVVRVALPPKLRVPPLRREALARHGAA
ncbi:oxygenase MpaB family protein [Lentzea sp. NPDC060358]|uniref:oxygenase MpaB family protein n=1 Tax=Lentzea sp. NPDC060358 TaxID=3347103 RepID=UPI003668199E